MNYWLISKFWFMKNRTCLMSFAPSRLLTWSSKNIMIIFWMMYIEPFWKLCYDHWDDYLGDCNKFGGFLRRRSEDSKFWATVKFFDVFFRCVGEVKRRIGVSRISKLSACRRCSWTTRCVASWCWWPSSSDTGRRGWAAWWEASDGKCNNWVKNPKSMTVCTYSKFKPFSSNISSIQQHALVVYKPSCPAQAW